MSGIIQGVYAGMGVYTTEDLQPTAPCALYKGTMYPDEEGVKKMEASMNGAGQGDQAVYTMQVESIHRGRNHLFFVDGRDEKVMLGSVLVVLCLWS
jgi:hypothetical protein